MSSFMLMRSAFYRGVPSKLVPNVPVRPNQNGTFHLMYQPKISEFWVEWKAPQRNSLIHGFQKRKTGSCMDVRFINLKYGLNDPMRRWQQKRHF